MINLKYYEVGDCYDVEGRGPWNSIGKFVHKSDADKFAIKSGNYGKNADVKVINLSIAENIDEHVEYTERQHAQKGLNKLTHEEYEALKKHFGLKPER